MRPGIGRWVTSGALLLLLTGCWLRGSAPQQEQPDPNQALDRVLAEIRRGEFRSVQSQLQRLRFDLPASHPKQAEVRYYLAESYFTIGDYPEAVERFRDVSEEYPESDYAPVALLRLGDSHLRQWRKPDLDPTPGFAALATYQELAQRYPNSDAAQRAQPHGRQLQNWFAEKTYKTGLFYLKRRAYDSAILYFKDVVATYPGTRHAPLALLRLVDAYGHIGYLEEREETCAHLRQFYSEVPGLAERCPATVASPAGPDSIGTRP
jgi:outer membrane protein assembly factor BamD